MDWLDLLAVQGTLKSLLQHHSSKASTLRCSAFFIVQLSHPYMTTWKTIALTRWTFVGKISLVFNMLSRLVITKLRQSKIPVLLWSLQCLPKIILVFTELISVFRVSDYLPLKMSWFFYPAHSSIRIYPIKILWSVQYSIINCVHNGVQHIFILFILQNCNFILVD